MGRPEAPGMSIFATADILDGRSVTGRPLVEFSPRQSTELRDAMDASGVPTVYRPHHYRDSRTSPVNYDVVINKSALDETMEYRQPLLDTMAWVRRAVYGDNPPENPDIVDLQNLARVVTVLPPYLYYRAEDPLPLDGLPASVGVAMKAGMGIVEHANLRMDVGDPNESAQGTAVYTSVNKSRLLIGFTLPDDATIEQGAGRGVASSTSDKPKVEGCAAPPGLITQTIDALTLGIGGDPDRSELNDLVRDPFGLKQFAQAYYKNIELQKEYGVNKLSLFSYLVELEGEVNDEAILDLIEFNERQTEIRDKMAETQSSMNVALGRDPASAPPIERSEVERLTNGRVHEEFGEEYVSQLLAKVEAQVTQRLREVNGQIAELEPDPLAEFGFDIEGEEVPTETGQEHQVYAEEPDMHISHRPNQDRDEIS